MIEAKKYREDLLAEYQKYHDIVSKNYEAFWEVAETLPRDFNIETPFGYFRFYKNDGQTIR